MLIAIASTMHWDCHTIDVKSAYLQGDSIQRKIFLKPPKEYDEGKLWRLKKQCMVFVMQRELGTLE